MARVWSEERKLDSWLEVELAALDAWAELGVVPRTAAAAIRSDARVPTPERVAEIERETGHDVAAFVDAVGENLDDKGRRWLHYGLTSSDVLDTALALQIREAGALVLDGLDALLSIVQMPPGVPVACVGVDNARNAAVLAARILQVASETAARLES